MMSGGGKLPLLPRWERTQPEGLVDFWLLGSAVSLLVIGFLMITSASMEVASVRVGNAFHFSIRQLTYLSLGLAIAGLTYRFPTEFWRKTGPWWLGLSFLLLVVVLVPGIGKEVNGSIRWIRIGPVNIQPSELAKLSMVFYLAGYLVRRLDEVRSQWSGFIKPMVVVGGFVALLLFEPDFGASVVLVGTVLGMIFLGGMRLGHFLMVIVGALALALAAVYSQPYRLERLKVYLNPWADPFGSGYQLAQAQIAFGRGEWFGTGLGNSVQKLFYLPEAHTDFVFSVLAEETGLVGALVVVALYGILVFRAFRIGRIAELAGRGFQAYMAFGIALIFAGQAFINIGVNVGVLPTKGLTLPLVSYGGSSLLVSMAMLALLLKVEQENRLLALERTGTRQSGNKAKPGSRKRSSAEGHRHGKQGGAHE